MWWDDPAWQRMPQKEYDRYWDNFYARFSFRPSTTKHPGITEPTPSVTFDLAPVFASPPDEWREAEDRLTTLCLDAMKEVFGSERIVVLNWQHDAMWLTPRLFNPSEDEDWAIPLFPNGDYYIFLNEDMSDGIFGHPWEETLCLFGSRMLRALEADLTTWLAVRRHT